MNVLDILQWYINTYNYCSILNSKSSSLQLYQILFPTRVSIAIYYRIYKTNTYTQEYSNYCALFIHTEIRNINKYAPCWGVTMLNELKTNSYLLYMVSSNYKQSCSRAGSQNFSWLTSCVSFSFNALQSVLWFMDLLQN